MEQNRLSASIQKYHATVFRVALGYAKNFHDAQDIAQDVFFKLYKQDRTFPTDEAEKAWLIRVTINESKNLLKSAWLRKRVDLNDDLAAPEECDLWLFEYVQKLKPIYRTVIYLYYYEQYTAKEIAAILKKPQATIETQLHRAKKHLRESIIKEEDYYAIRL
ncbi:MAG: RNA polymerase sigma factor [Oscillospiraceae bacterium]|jgi:RNA polymerase sigma-70 factor (ECF subfamily)|nr:RNA polymerase sigma factor [Oscillospiraceae bacterium]